MSLPIVPRSVVIACAALVFLSACATPGHIPNIRSAQIRPNQLEPGQTAVITVDVADYHNIVAGIEGVVEGYPDRKFRLRDDGGGADQEAGDGVWTMDVAVPFTAPPGDHEITFTAYDEDGNVITVPDEDGYAVPLSAKLDVSIHYEEEVEPAGEAEE